MTYEEFAVQALVDGASTIDIIEQLQARYGLSPKEAEALVDDMEGLITPRQLEPRVSSSRPSVSSARL